MVLWRRVRLGPTWTRLLLIIAIVIAGLYWDTIQVGYAFFT